MLFLTKKTIVSVLTLGCLLSIAPKTHAAVSPREVLAGFVAAGVIFEGVRKVEQNKDKATVFKVRDEATNRWQQFLDLATSKKGIAALLGGVSSFLLVKHGTNLLEAPIVKQAVALVTPPASSAPGK